MNIVHVNFQVVSNSRFIITLITLVPDPLVDLPGVGLHVAGQVCAVLAFLTSERLGNQRRYEWSTFIPRSEDFRVSSGAEEAPVVLVLLKLQPREGGEGTLVTEVLLALTVVLALLLEVAVFLSLVFVE